MTLVCIDNHILIWGIRKEATPGQEPMIARAEAFIDYLEKKKTRVIVPSVVVGEFLARTPVEIHEKVVAVLERRFQVPPFDAAAAACAASLFQKHQGSKSNYGRAILKADIQILATAITRKARILYTHDEELAKIAQAYLRVEKMPEFARQEELFECPNGKNHGRCDS